MNSQEFLGRGISFPPRLDEATGRFVMCGGEEDIKQAVYTIVKTKKGERAMLPEFGCDLHEYVFDLPDPTFASLLENSIVTALTQWEPRIINVQAAADLSEVGRGVVILHIGYTVRSTNNPNNLVFPYYLYEGVGEA